MSRTTYAFAACALLAFAAGVLVGGAFGGGDAVPGERQGARTPDSESGLQRELEAARSRLAEQERLIADLRRAGGEREATKVEPKAHPGTGPKEDGDDKSAVPLPGTLVGTATFNPNPSEKDWRWAPAAINPDQGQEGGKPYSLSVIVQPETGALSIALFGEHDKGSLASSGFASRRTSGDRMREVSRSEGSAEGVQLTAPGGTGGSAVGYAASLIRAREMSEIWKEVAESSGLPVKAPSILGVHTLKFKVGGVGYTLITCAEWGPDGSLAGVTFRDGR